MGLSLLDIVGTNMNNDKFGMSWDFTIFDAQQEHSQSYHPPMPKLFTGSTPNCNNLGFRQKLEIKESPMNEISLLREVASSRNFPCFSPQDILPCSPSVLLKALKRGTAWESISGYFLANFPFWTTFL